MDSLLQALDDVHWDDRDGAYYDVGMHSEQGAFRNLAVIRCASSRDQNDAIDEAVAPELLQQGARDLCPSHHPRFLWPVGDGAGNILTRPTYIESDADKSVQFVRRVGVVNIFPMLLRLLPEDSPRLPRMLDLLADKSKLWSAHGMRSLGKTDMCA
jgi:mannosyl-oligosaccharide glucosidase